MNELLAEAMEIKQDVEIIGALTSRSVVVFVLSSLSIANAVRKTPLGMAYLIGVTSELISEVKGNTPDGTLVSSEDRRRLVAAVGRKMVEWAEEA